MKSCRAPVPTIAAWPDGASVAHYRCVLPLRALHRQRLARARPVHPDPTEDEHPEGDIIILQRNFDAWRLERALALQAEGTLIVADEDDNVHGTPIDGRSYRAVAEGNVDQMARHLFPRRRLLQQAMGLGIDLASGCVPGEVETNRRVIRRLKEVIAVAQTEAEAIAAARHAVGPWVSVDTLRAADLVTVTTPELAAAYRRFNPHIAVLPNCIDLQAPCYRESNRRRPHDGIIVGWAGAPRSAPDLAALASVFAELLSWHESRPSERRIRLLIGGANYFATGQLARVPGVARFVAELSRWEPDPSLPFDALESACGRYLYRSWAKDVEAVPLMYADADIGVVPNVSTSPLNHCKSDIKGLEMAGMGVPCVASPIPSYVRWRGAGTGCVLVKAKQRHHDWITPLTRLIRDPGYRRHLADEALAFAQTRSIDRWAPKWMEQYDEAARRTNTSWRGAHRTA